MKSTKLLPGWKISLSCGVATFPQGTQIDIKTDQSKGAATNNFSEFEHFFNENVPKVILGGTLTTDIGSTGSYSAPAQVHNDVRADIAMSDREALANKHNWVMSKNESMEFGRRYCISAMGLGGGRRSQDCYC